MSLSEKLFFPTTIPEERRPRFPESQADIVYEDLSRPVNQPEEPAVAPLRAKADLNSTSLMYVGLWIFTLLYYLRPNDWLPGAAKIPFEKIAGFITCAGVIAALVKHGVRRLPVESKILILFFVQLCLTIPLARWKGGSFEIVLEQFSKVVLISLAIAICVLSSGRLRKLLLLQALMVGFLAAVSVSNSGGGDRLKGILHGVFENPNDLALSVCLAAPLAYFFLFQSSGVIKKLFWGGLLLMMGYAVIATFSRAGFLSLMTALAVSLWHFGRRSAGVALPVVLVAGVLASSVMTGQYAHRLSTIFSPDEDVTGSSSERQELLQRSFEVTLHNPLFGVGPGNFEQVSGRWRVSHNSYTQLSAEAGLPALALFLWMLWKAFRNLNNTIGTSPRSSELWSIAGALRASLAALSVGAFFASVAYQFFPYFLLSYATATAGIASLGSSKIAKLAPRTADGIIELESSE